MASSPTPQGGALLPSKTPDRSEKTSFDDIRQFSRSPHPYHRKGLNCLDPQSQPADYCHSQHLQWPRTSSDSGTEADDESTGILKGLPAPPLRPRKGLRPGWNGASENGHWLPVLKPWPSLVRSASRGSQRSSSEEAEASVTELQETVCKRQCIEILRRLLETSLFLSVGVVGLAQDSSRSLAWAWRKELLTHTLLVTGLYAAYPLTKNGRIRLANLSSFVIPSTFDPAPLLYPILIPIYVSLSLSHRGIALVLPNILLSLSSLPGAVVPLYEWNHGGSIVHWMITLIPIVVSEHLSGNSLTPLPLNLRGLNSELLTLVFPLHQALIPTLDFLLTTSVLPAELQLLTSALINLFLFAASPQAEILKALLWLGGLCIFISCRQVLRWEVALARIPSWKFRRSPRASHAPKNILNVLDHKLCQRLSRTTFEEEVMSDSDSPESHLAPLPRRTTHELREKVSSGEQPFAADKFPRQQAQTAQQRRHTLASFEDAVRSERVRKWLYALYVYIAVLAIILGPVRKYVGEHALHGAEPFGWALGYLLGNVSWFRFWVVMWNLEHWIPLPIRWDSELLSASYTQGWVENLRQSTFGEANTRLLIMAYCTVVILVGLAIVFQLSSVVEVDTRRKVFHGMMVLMFLPTIYIDPAFCALALVLVLAIFLLLDLFRASQLPPISRPLTYFLAPYVDGRDHRGPVIVSHIFLLIGCSIPLWLSLTDVPRAEGRGALSAWDVLSRDVSMVSGVVCVGMGDAAASLVGRRVGRLKWFWGGGKSLEGSVAFAIAVTSGLVVARAWLAMGQWRVSGSDGEDCLAWLVMVLKATVAAAGTSATEAILTGCNDNVVVPVILWLLVRGLGL
ncbi:hypothetical protein EYZ11_002406 [Aspergillus tanneri]|uniref:dolichol kinase n=1 Tax=Aspergillus tanneri TaxID=1220188 RepID=A0A4S3JSX8_9EURO|nr:hypothetical protein EYZ11_002406 [Aspergillus tanneri]